MREGLEEFDFIYNKFQECDNQSQKEKLEGDLKKEIKKLQRHREQIKNWLNGTEVKDKTALGEHRRLIETEMERFKDVEKAMKTKAFSNEALASTSDRLDPRQREKNECADFIQSNIEELQRQMEAQEAKIESLSGTGKKKKLDSGKQAQISACNDLIERHKWHISMLESVLRHLENANVSVEQVNEIKDDVEYYVESNQDPGFVEDDTMYDVLGLDDIEDSFAVIAGEEDTASPSPGPQLQSSVQHPTPTKKSKKKESPAPALSHEPESTHVHTLASSSGSNGTHVSVNAPTTTPITSLASQLQQTHLNLGLNTPPANSPKLKSVTTTLKPALTVEAPKLKYSTVVSQSITPTVATPKKSNTPLHSFSTLAQDESTGPSTPNGRSTPSIDTHVAHSYFSGDLAPVFNFADEANYSNLPNIASYVKSLDSAKNRIFEFREQESFHVPSKKSLPPPKECAIKLPPLEDIIQHLETSLLTCPDSHDADTPFKYEPVNPFVTQLSYPADPLLDLYSPKTMELLELDTLQYLFYYHWRVGPSQLTPFYNSHAGGARSRGEYVQWLAARELRRRGWRFYKHAATWASAEGGELKCFDHLDSWLVRRQLGFNPQTDEVEGAY